MKKQLLLLLLVLLGTAHGLAAQQLYRPGARANLRFSPGKEIICYSSGIRTDSRLSAPEAFRRMLEARRGGRPLAQQSTFIVNYVGFSDSAKAAFQYAVDIWQSILISPVPIRVTAYWTDLGGAQSGGSYALGAAGPTAFVSGFPGATRYNTSYPVALAEKLARTELNGTTPDLVARFNSNKIANWYFKTDGVTAGTGGREDLISTVLHELGHGLGFVSSFGGVQGYGFWGDDDNYGYPFIFDRFMENTAGQKLIDPTAFVNPSEKLFAEITGNGLYFDGPVTTAQNGGLRAKLYAPTTYSLGSSVSHLDETTYPRGNPNSLMTPFSGSGEVIHNPGPLTVNMMTDMGWKSTSVLHEPFRDSEELIGQPVVFRARVISDTTLRTPVTLSYTLNDTTRANATTVQMQQQGGTDQYVYTLAASSQPRVIRYWISVTDNSGRTFTSPPEAPQVAVWAFQIGPDNTPPQILHTPLTSVLASTDSLRLAATVFDNYNKGIDTVYVEYRINGTAYPSVPMRRVGYYVNNGVATGNIVVEGVISLVGVTLRGGDRIEYRLVARDRARTPNTAYLPASGYYTVTVVGTKAAAAKYVNTFDEATSAEQDFSGTGFKVLTPAGFSTGAIHSDHPYADGLASQNYQANFTYTLLTPIQVSGTDPFIRFDEVVLVEPGESGSVFGSQDFYDYVVVEGSKDGGKTWTPFRDGWDSRAQSVWLTAYNSLKETRVINGFSVENSTAAGNSTLYRRREINMTANGNFAAGQQVLVRFRLYADQYSHGWGWAIDNLYIQEKPPVITASEPVVTATTLGVFPNPSQTGEFVLELALPQAVKGPVSLAVTSLRGQPLYHQTLEARSFRQRLDLRTLAPGTYLLRVQTPAETLVKRLVVGR